MFKKIVLPLIVLIIIVGVVIFRQITKENTNIDKFYLDNKYYENGNFIKTNSTEINNLKKDSYVLFTYNNYCTFSIPCDKIFEEVMKKYNIDFLSIPFEDFKSTKFYKKVKYAPSILLIKEGNLVAYLDAESDDDLNKYQDVSSFESWINEYVYLEK